jgi:hypothetical protein
MAGEKLGEKDLHRLRRIGQHRGERVNDDAGIEVVSGVTVPPPREFERRRTLRPGLRLVQPERRRRQPAAASLAPGPRNAD